MSRLLNQPPSVVYQSRRNETDGLDSTTRSVIDVHLSAQTAAALDAVFIRKCAAEGLARPSSSGPPEQKQDVLKRREAILQEVFREVITVDVVLFDFSLVTYFSTSGDEGDQSSDSNSDDSGEPDATHGCMETVPPPSCEMAPSRTVPGAVHLSILPRTLPISSTHSGRPFRLIIRISTASIVQALVGEGSVTPKGQPVTPTAGALPIIDEVLYTSPFHVLAKEPSKQSTTGPRPRGQATKKRKRAALAAARGDLDGSPSANDPLAWAAVGVSLSPRDSSLLTAVEMAVRSALKDEADLAAGPRQARTPRATLAQGAASTHSIGGGPSVASLLVSDLNRFSTARLMASGAIPSLSALVEGQARGNGQAQANVQPLTGRASVVGQAVGFGLGARESAFGPPSKSRRVEGSSGLLTPKDAMGSAGAGIVPGRAPHMAAAAADATAPAPVAPRLNTVGLQLPLPLPLPNLLPGMGGQATAGMGLRGKDGHSTGAGSRPVLIDRHFSQPPSPDTSLPSTVSNARSDAGSSSSSSHGRKDSSAAGTDEDEDEDSAVSRGPSPSVSLQQRLKAAVAGADKRVQPTFSQHRQLAADQEAHSVPLVHLPQPPRRDSLLFSPQRGLAGSTGSVQGMGLGLGSAFGVRVGGLPSLPLMAMPTAHVHGRATDDFLSSGLGMGMGMDDGLSLALGGAPLGVGSW